MTTFDERKKGFEAKYKHDQETQFKVTARRNKLLGLWVAEQMGLTGPQAEEYAKSIVAADFEKPGDQDVVTKILADFKAKGIEMSEHRLRKHMDDLMKIATDQVRNEV